MTAAVDIFPDGEACSDLRITRNVLSGPRAFLAIGGAVFE
jgi:hypothetical protein